MICSKHLFAAIFSFALTLLLVTGAEANPFNSDASTCDLNGKTKLEDICSGGFGMPEGGSMAELMERSPNIANMIKDAAWEAGVDVRLALAVSGKEALMSACAGSFSGVKGPMQLTQSTGNGYGYDRDLLEENIKGGIAHLKYSVEQCLSSTNTTCLAKYYNGSTAAQQRGWAKGVAKNLAQLNQMADAAIPQGCKECKPTYQENGIPTPSPSDSDIEVESFDI